MSTNEKKGITTKVDLGLHAKAKEFMASHDDMKMESFISNAIESYLATEQQKGRPPKMRTLAFQVPEDFFQEVKDYLDRHGNMKQNKFVLGLIRQELDRDLAEREALKAAELREGDEELDEEQDEGEYNEEIVDDEDEKLTENELTEDDEQTEDELTEDELDEDTDIEETDGEQDEGDGEELDEADEEESEDEELSEDEEETEGMSMSGM